VNGTSWDRGPGLQKNKMFTSHIQIIPFCTYVPLIIIPYRQYCQYLGGKTYFKLSFKNFELMAQKFIAVDCDPENNRGRISRDF